jgi:protein subunit release factor B
MHLIEANRVNRLLKVCLETAIALNHKGSATVVLGPVDNYRAAMTAAARKMLARKLVSVLS